jgi:hypothetical protein
MLARLAATLQAAVTADDPGRGAAGRGPGSGRVPRGRRPGGVFLAADSAAWLTGVTLDVAGGDVMS